MAPFSYQQQPPTSQPQMYQQPPPAVQPQRVSNPPPQNFSFAPPSQFVSAPHNNSDPRVKDSIELCQFAIAAMKVSHNALLLGVLSILCVHDLSLYF
jgi:hypothetical protein